MSPNSRASLIRSATSRRLSLERYSISALSLSRPSGVRMTSFCMTRSSLSDRVRRKEKPARRADWGRASGGSAGAHGSNRRPQVSEPARRWRSTCAFRRLVSLALPPSSLPARRAGRVATPVANNDGEYAAFGRVFPDPLGGCQRRRHAPPARPTRRATSRPQQFIGVDEFVRAASSSSTRSPSGSATSRCGRWTAARTPTTAGTAAGTDELAAFPGNNLGRCEFTPRRSTARSASRRRATPAASRTSTCCA